MGVPDTGRIHEVFYNRESPRTVEKPQDRGFSLSRLPEECTTEGGICPIERGCVKTESNPELVSLWESGGYHSRQFQKAPI
jgi:hypothetical protein